MAKDIIKLVEEKEAQARKNRRRGVIISPAAIGDCILMLPLADFMKKSLQLGAIDFVGHTQYIDYFPGRTAVDTIRSIDSIALHRLFSDSGAFTIEDRDPLSTYFTGYEWIASFIGHGNDNFESNLLFTVHCTHTAEVTVLPLTALDNTAPEHISSFYIRNFAESNSLSIPDKAFNTNDVFIKPCKSDIGFGQELLESVRIDPLGKIILIHPGSGGKEKCWHIDNYCALADAMAQKDIQVVFLVGPAEQERFEEKTILRLSEIGTCLSRLDLTQIVQLIACSDLYIGNDSGITHLAAAMGIKTLAAFGPTNPDIYKPLGPHVTVFRPDLKSFTTPCSDNQIRAVEIVFQMLDD